ncbi:MAG: cation diffusion facilitator family transporter [Ancalomicrobiaceae bacterium]|nr:cation diffusion facilitator family transporter [Ancalomicrobiaceae bacterium]
MTETASITSIKANVAFNSILASSAITILKFTAALWTGSLGLLSDAIHSLLDVGATLITFFAVRVSDQPADEQHNYGHAKIESVASLIETGLLLIVSLGIIYEAIMRLIGGHNDVDANPVAFVVLLVSIGVDFWRSHLLAKTARETKSAALEADALHFASDMWSSACVFVGLALVLLGWATADAFAAIIVSAFIAHAAWQLGRRTFNALLDAAPEGAAERVRAVAERVPGVVAVERLRMRPAGSVIFIDIEVAVSRTRSMQDIANVKRALITSLKEVMPEAEASVIAQPRALDDETIHDRVMVIARDRALAVHHVTVQQVAGQRLAISLDLEVVGAMPLDEAHRIATELENAIAFELATPLEIETHIEPLLLDRLSGLDLPLDETNEILTILARAADARGRARNVHNVRARRTDEGVIVNFHCKLPPGTSVNDVHTAIDDLERALTAARPDVKRAIGHAEPDGVVHPDRAPGLTANGDDNGNGLD